MLKTAFFKTWFLVLVASSLDMNSLALAEPKHYAFEMFSIPGDGQIAPGDVNDKGDIVGRVDHFDSGVFKPMGFFRHGIDTTFIDFPGSEPLNGTQADGINNAGLIVGTFRDVTTDLKSHGFVRDNGILQPFDVPDAVDTECGDVNNNGWIVGRTFLASDPEVGTAFIRVGDKYTLFRPDGVLGSFGIGFSGVNDRGNTVGSLLDDSGFHAFAVLDGVYTPFDIPGSRRTSADSINNSNQIVGYFDDDFGTHGFVMDATGIYQLDAPESDSNYTFLTGINQTGTLVGAVFFNSFPGVRVLVATPCGEVSETCISIPRIGDPVIEFVQAVTIDIKPGSSVNDLTPGRREAIPVAILGSEEFDVENVDLSTLRFGPGQATPRRKPAGHKQDVNEDGFADLVSFYLMTKTGISNSDTRSCVSGNLLDGTRFRGCDAIRIAHFSPRNPR